MTDHYHTVLPAGYVVIKAKADGRRTLSFRYRGMAQFVQRLFVALARLEDSYNVRLRDPLSLVLESRNVPSRDIPRTVFGIKPSLVTIGVDEEVRDISAGFEVGEFIDAALLVTHIARTLRQATAVTAEQMRKFTRKHYAPVVRGNINYRLSVQAGLLDAMETAGNELMTATMEACRGPGRTLDELAAELSAPRDDVVRAVLTMERCGLLDQLGREDGGRYRAPTPEGAESPADSSSTSGTKDLVSTNESVERNESVPEKIDDTGKGPKEYGLKRADGGPRS
ncbi:MAG: hypothetical protein QF415_04090 [Candidatus Undinarchaeales archaeon]|jgi:hypothetical protein|nr:hypothetical protein [Candidatus Undinarchaeales archaeon]